MVLVSFFRLLTNPLLTLQNDPTLSRLLLLSRNPPQEPPNPLQTTSSTTTSMTFSRNYPRIVHGPLPRFVLMQ